MLELDPSNSRYKEKVYFYKAKVAEQKRVKEIKRPKVLSCYELGYRFGRCATRSMKGLPCEPGTDISIPARCKSREDTKRGIEDGVRSAY